MDQLIRSIDRTLETFVTCTNETELDFCLLLNIHMLIKDELRFLSECFHSVIIVQGGEIRLKMPLTVSQHSSTHVLGRDGIIPLFYVLIS